MGRAEFLVFSFKNVLFCCLISHGNCIELYNWVFNLTCKLRDVEESKIGNEKSKNTSISLNFTFHFTIAQLTRETAWSWMFQWYHTSIWALKAPAEILRGVQHWDLQALTEWAGSSAQVPGMSVIPEEGVWNLRKHCEFLTAFPIRDLACSKENSCTLELFWSSPCKDLVYSKKECKEPLFTFRRNKLRNPKSSKWQLNETHRSTQTWENSQKKKVYLSCWAQNLSHTPV